MNNLCNQKVLILVTTFNRKDTLHKCLKSIEDLQIPETCKCSTLVVDAGSKDGTISMLKEEFPEANSLVMSENRGYVGCVNEGLRYANRNASDFVLLITDDALVSPNTLASFIKAMLSQPKAAVAGCKINHIAPDQKGGKQIYTFTGSFFSHFFCKPHQLPNNYGKIADCDWVNGAVLCMRPNFIKQVGYLDERFFTYFDELDLGRRVKRHGYRVIYVPFIEVRHKSGVGFWGITSSLGRPGPRYYLTRNRALLEWKSGFGRFLLFLPYYLIIGICYRALVLGLIRKRGDLAKAVLRGGLDFFRGRFGPGPY